MTIQRGFSLSLAIAASVLLGGCMTGPTSSDPQQSPLQIRARETRTYEERDAKATLKAVLNVLQDEGYLVDYGNTDLGLLHASSGSGTQIEATVNVTDFAGGVKVRINFQNKLTNGSLTWASVITDPKFYQEFFAKLDRGLFIQKQGL